MLAHGIAAAWRDPGYPWPIATNDGIASSRAIAPRRCVRGPAGALRRVWNTRDVRHETARQLVLYVHPSGHLNDLVVPAGAVTCMNAIPGPKLGRYAHEVADEEILEAAVVAIDLHWALALSGLEPLVRHVRALRPDVPIVIGGITAGTTPRSCSGATRSTTSSRATARRRSRSWSGASAAVSPPTTSRTSTRAGARRRA
ncbi:MAG: cobalamin B12-binding domain-containing protein [Sandaracinaceae bacterium]|nr:cobalamin B12-binding domain-containing protein [Sandaracinaceae bacterium]